MKINKSQGATSTEIDLAKLCEDTFLNLWSYPNPCNDSGKELCDLIAIYENHIFIFFDRESNKFDTISNNVELAWSRWKREVIDKQISTAMGAERYIRTKNSKIYLDAKCNVEIPVPVPAENITIHKIIVAHGAEKACKGNSPHNINGSLGIIYSSERVDNSHTEHPFVVYMNKHEKIHIFDSFNLKLIFKELDTFSDFVAYILEKEKIIHLMHAVVYSGEEDILAQYLMNFDVQQKTHYLVNDLDVDIVAIPEGAWNFYVNSEAYRNKCQANKISYLWDKLIQHTGDNALNGKLTGNANVFTKSAIYEMAKESRMHRRILATRLQYAINNFPDLLTSGFMRQISFISIDNSYKAYIFLQVAYSNNVIDYALHREKRVALLEIACGVAKNKFPDLNIIVGIAIDAPKHHNNRPEDFLLFPCNKWDQSKINYYTDRNKEFNFFSDKTSLNHDTEYEFPEAKS